jgi:hypothetical protein
VALDFAYGGEAVFLWLGCADHRRESKRERRGGCSFFADKLFNPANRRRAMRTSAIFAWLTITSAQAVHGESRK